MTPQPPTGQDPVDPSGAFGPPPPPPQGAAPAPRNGTPGPGMPPMGPGMMPPPPGPMMPWMPPPPPPPRGGGFVRGILVTLALAIFGLSLSFNIYFLLFSGLMSSGGLEEQSIRAGSDDQRIVALPIDGLITDSRAQQLQSWLKSIENDTRVKALVLEIDSPGGTVTASDEIRHAVEHFKQKRNVPVAVAMGGLTASGGYYISTAADYLVAQPTTLTGSIGVRLDMYNVSELAKKWGVEETTVTAPEGGLKNAGSMFKPQTPRERAYLQGLIDDAYSTFTGLVEKSRKLNKPVSEVCTGQIFTATQAKAIGLIDKIGYADDAYAWAASQAGLSTPSVVRFRARPGLLDVFGGAESGKSGVTVHIDRSMLDELQRPQLMYLWRGE